MTVPFEAKATPPVQYHELDPIEQEKNPLGWNIIESETDEATIVKGQALTTHCFIVSVRTQSLSGASRDASRRSLSAVLGDAPENALIRLCATHPSMPLRFVPRTRRRSRTTSETCFHLDNGALVCIVD
jgi:hypothetical protein